jgi:hypothetical protein
MSCALRFTLTGGETTIRQFQTSFDGGDQEILAEAAFLDPLVNLIVAASGRDADGRERTMVEWRRLPRITPRQLF